MVLFAGFFILTSVTIFLKRIHYNWLIAHNYTDNASENNLLDQYKCAYYTVIDDLYGVRNLFKRFKAQMNIKLNKLLVENLLGDCQHLVRTIICGAHGQRL